MRATAAGAALLFAAGAAADADKFTYGHVWFGAGCFWEQQYGFTMVELDADGHFKRSDGLNGTTASITSVVGYAGSQRVGDDGLVCYDTGLSNDYGQLGHCEAVRIMLDAGKEHHQFAALVVHFYDSFTPSEQGFLRADVGDQGSPYRVVVGIPGGVNGPLYKILDANNQPRGPYNMRMNLKEDKAGNTTGDEVNTLWVMDSDKFPFYLGEQYHQYHSNFFDNPQQPADYGSWYLNDEWALQIKLGNIPKGGCPDGPHWLAAGARATKDAKAAVAAAR